jgi:hypothetical protein
VPLLLLGEIPEQAAHAHVLRLLGGRGIEFAGPLLHALHFLAG